MNDDTVYYDLVFPKTCYIGLNEPCCKKTGFLHMRKQRRRSASRLTVKLISAFVFAIRIVQSLFYLNPKLHASSHIQ